MNRPIKFEYQKFADCTVVALDSSLKDYRRFFMKDGQMMQEFVEKTVKDCRHIDGCVYLHLGTVSDTVMVDLIEKFQKLKLEKGWKKNNGLILPDNKFKI